MKWIAPFSISIPSIMWAPDCDIINKSSYLEMVVQWRELRQKMISCRRESQSDTTWHRDHQSLVTFCQFLRVLHITDFNNNWTLSNLGNVFKTCGHKLLEVRQIFIKFKEAVVVMWPDHHLENISYYALLRTALQTSWARFVELVDILMLIRRKLNYMLRITWAPAGVQLPSLQY